MQQHHQPQRQAPPRRESRALAIVDPKTGKPISMDSDKPSSPKKEDSVDTTTSIQSSQSRSRPEASSEPAEISTESVETPVEAPVETPVETKGIHFLHCDGRFCDHT